MVVCVDVKFVINSTKEHPYHCTVYSYCKADWGGLSDHLRDVPWLDIFMHDATYTAKVKIGIDCYIPHRMFQLKHHSSPWFTPCAAAIAHLNHYFHQYNRNVTPKNKKLFCDSHNHCTRVLKDARSNYAETAIRSCDIWGICNSVLFYCPEILVTSTENTNFSCNFTLDNGSQQLPD